MYIHLREREVDTVFRKLLVNPFIHVIEHVPIVRNLGPGPHDECHLAFIKALDIDTGRIIGFRQQCSEMRFMGFTQFL